MRSLFNIVGATLLAMTPAISLAAPAAISIVNATGADINGMSVRRVGSQAWKPVPLTAPAGKAASAPFSDPDCAFDIKVKLSNGEDVTFSAVNLCEAKLLTLRRSGANAWVDYD
jgi:hypothetical protein